MEDPWKSKEAHEWFEWKLTKDSAERAHDEHHRGLYVMLQTVISFGVEAIRTVALINGGAAVATLALVGAVFQSNRGLAISIVHALLIFVAGVIAAGLSSGAAYFAQFFYQMHLSAYKLDYTHPYVHEPEGRRYWHVAGICFHVLCVLLIISSYVALGAGTWKILALIS